MVTWPKKRTKKRETREGTDNKTNAAGRAHPRRQQVRIRQAQGGLHDNIQMNLRSNTFLGEEVGALVFFPQGVADTTLPVPIKEIKNRMNLISKF